MGEEAEVNHRAVPFLLALIVAALGAGVAMAGDIVTVPTANQVMAGEIDVADYYIFVDNDALVEAIQPLDIDFVRVQTFYMGLTDELEIDVHRYDVDVLGVESIYNVTYLVLKEDMNEAAQRRHRRPRPDPGVRQSLLLHLGRQDAEPARGRAADKAHRAPSREPGNRGQHALC